MHRSPSVLAMLTVAAATLTGAAAPAQPAAMPARAVLEAVGQRVPIHTGPDDPSGGRYGIWAAGPDYKVSFHDGFRFYPVLGVDAPRNLPLGWRTESVTSGGAPLPIVVAPAAGVRVGDWRYEFRLGPVVEAYDVRSEGVEQTFTVLERPVRAGDLCVTGVLETELSVPARFVDGRPVAADAEIEFRDDRGVPRVRYGRAVAFDAAGRRTPVARRLSGRRLWLTVPGSWLADARFPVTIDPLTPSSAVLHVSHAVAHLDYHASGSNGCLVFSRHSAVGRKSYFSGGVDVEVVGSQCCSSGGTRHTRVRGGAESRRHVRSRSAGTKRTRPASGLVAVVECVGRSLREVQRCFGGWTCRLGRRRFGGYAEVLEARGSCG